MCIRDRLNPILAALFVTGLSGSAITAELGEIKANQAIDHLAAMGVDPHGFFVLPRLLGMILSLPILTCWLNVGVTVGAAAMLDIYQNVPLPIFLGVCASGLSYPSLALTGAMAVSYTHLDVYKRQRPARPASPRAVTSPAAARTR